MIITRTGYSWKPDLRRSFALFTLFFGLFLLFPSIGTSQASDDLFSRAVSQYVNGSDRLALEYLNQVLRTDPDSTNARELRQQIRVKLADQDLSPKSTGKSEDVSQDEVGQPPSGESDTSERGSEGYQPYPDQQTLGSNRDSSDTNRRPGAEEFQPVPEENRKKESPTAPKINHEPQDVVRHFTKSYSTPTRQTKAIYGVEARHFKDRVRYVIHTSGTVDVITSQIYNPPMIIVDIPNSVDRLPSSPLPVGFPNHLRIRHSQYQLDPINVTRVVIDLDNWNENYNIYRAAPGDRIVVDIFDSPDAMESFRDLTPKANADAFSKGTGSVKSFDTKRTEDSTSDLRFQRKSGNNQTIKPNGTAGEPLKVKLTNKEGKPLSGDEVVFEVLQGEGKIDANADQPGNQTQSRTDENGVSRATYTASEQAGTTIVQASVPPHELQLHFSLNVEPGEPVEIKKIAGDQQEAMFGRAVGTSPEIRVLDRYGNPVTNVRVEFKDQSEEGFLDVDLDNEGIQRSGRTDSDGRLTVDLYRTASSRSTNHLIASVDRPDTESLSTRFTIFGNAQLLSIDFKQANLQDVLRTLSEIAQWNIVQAEQVEGRPVSEMTVSVHLRDVTAIRALDTILDVKGLSRVSDGNVMKIVPKPDAIRKGVPVLNPAELENYQGNNMVTVTYQFTYLNANNQLASTLQQALMAENSSILADPNSNSITITDLANNQRKLKKVLNNIDQPNQKFQVEVVELDYKDAEGFKNQLTELLPLGRQANITSNARSNALMIYGEATMISRVKKLVELLDRSGQLQENYKFIDMTGFDEVQIANQVNAILGLQVVPIEELSNIDFDFEGSDEAIDFIRSARQIDIDDLLESANVIPMPRLNQILVFGPKDVQEITVDIITKLKTSQAAYLRSREFHWYEPKMMPMEQMIDLIGNIGNLQVEAQAPEFEALLLTSPDSGSLQQGLSFLRNIDRELSSGREVIVYTPQFLEPSELASDVETYYEDLQSAQESGQETSGDPLPRVLHEGEERVVFVANKGDAKLLRDLIQKLDQNFYKEQSILTYFPDYVAPEDLEEELSDLNIGRLLYVDGNRISLLVPRSRRERLRKTLRNIDTSGHTTDVVYLEHTRAENIITSLQTISQNMDLSVTFAADQQTNSVIYSAAKTAKRDVLRIIKKLDRWQKQVFIEGMILEYTITEGNEFRYQWFLNPQGNQVGDATAAPQGEGAVQFGNFAGGPAGTFAAILNENDFQAVLNVLANESQSEVLAKPQITAINNQEASIRVGDEQEIRIERQTDEGVVSTLETIEAFTELTVTPTITSNRHVLRDILISSDQFTTPASANVETQTTRRQTENSVLVQDGQTVVIGGLIEEETTDDETGIPYLKDIPLAGNLFKNSEEETNKRELVIFLTPRVVANSAESRQQSQRVRNQLQQITPPGININIDRAGQLERLQRLSPKKQDSERRQRAQQIVQYRETSGPYRNRRELLNVSGITEEILNDVLYQINYRVDVNSVSAEDLTRIKNIGPAAAEAIIEARDRVGTFSTTQTVKQILLEHGVSESYYQSYLRPIFTVAKTRSGSPGPRSLNRQENGVSSNSSSSSYPRKPPTQEQGTSSPQPGRSSSP